MVARLPRVVGGFALLLCGACGNGSSSGSGAAGTSGAAGDAGSGGVGGAAGTAVGRSVGCGTMPSSDSATKWTKHEIDLPTGSVDTTFVTAHPPDTGAQYTWTHRNYFVKLPAGYDPQQAYPVTIAGDACAGSETVGASGGYSVPTDSGELEAIKISQSYVTSKAATPGCPAFADDFTNSPEPAYIHAVIADVARTFCVDASKVFINGFDAGAFQAVMAGCTNTDELRAYGVQMGGGLRMQRPPCKDHPIAAMFVVGTLDTADPIGPLTTPKNDSLGSAPARDDLLQRNGCMGNATAPWNATYPKCVTYTGCPVKYPVVWCPLDLSHIATPSDPDTGVLETYRRQGLWDFYKSLP